MPRRKKGCGEAGSLLYLVKKKTMKRYPSDKGKKGIRRALFRQKNQKRKAHGRRHGTGTAWNRASCLRVRCALLKGPQCAFKIVPCPAGNDVGAELLRTFDMPHVARDDGTHLEQGHLFGRERAGKPGVLTNPGQEDASPAQTCRPAAPPAAPGSASWRWRGSAGRSWRRGWPSAPGCPASPGSRVCR